MIGDEFDIGTVPEPGSSWYVIQSEPILSASGLTYSLDTRLKDEWT